MNERAREREREKEGERDRDDTNTPGGATHSGRARHNYVQRTCPSTTKQRMRTTQIDKSTRKSFVEICWCKDQPPACTIVLPLSHVIAVLHLVFEGLFLPPEPKHLVSVEKPLQSRTDLSNMGHSRASSVRGEESGCGGKILMGLPATAPGVSF